MSGIRGPARRGARTAVAILVFVGLEIGLIALLAAIGVVGVPAVVIVVLFALLERLVYVRSIKPRGRG